MSVERQSYWRDTNNRILSEERILELLATETQGIFILDGGSGCVRGRMLNKLKKNQKVWIFSYEDIVKMMVHFCKKDISQSVSTRMAVALDVDGSIAIEDIDFLCGRSSTLELIMETLQSLSHNHLCIVTGNDLDALTPEIYMIKDMHYFTVCR